MTNHASPRALLDGIYALGERLRAALEEGDVDAVVDLVDQRGVLVERLRALEPPAWGAGEGNERAALLRQQHEAIVTAATAQEQRLVAAQGVLRQVQQARVQYGGRLALPRFLNKNLCG